MIPPISLMHRSAVCGCGRRGLPRKEVMDIGGKYECPICGERFREFHDKKLHVREHPEYKEKKK